MPERYKFTDLTPEQVRAIREDALLTRRQREIFESSLLGDMVYQTAAETNYSDRTVVRERAAIWRKAQRVTRVQKRGDRTSHARENVQEIV